MAALAFALASSSKCSARLTFCAFSSASRWAALTALSLDRSSPSPSRTRRLACWSSLLIFALKSLVATANCTSDMLTSSRRTSSLSTTPAAR
eukprot:1698285-Pyramimonas_sp.AAC.1